MGKRFLIGAFVFIGALASGFSGSLSFQILQKNENLENVCESALVIEDEILNYFFENGYIVSNVPASVSKSQEEDDKFYTDAYNEAVEGTVDQFCPIKLYFNGGEQENSRVSIGNMNKISWKIVSIRTGKVLEENSSAVKEDISRNEEANVREFAANFAMHIQKIIRQKA